MTSLNYYIDRLSSKPDSSLYLIEFKAHGNKWYFSDLDFSNQNPILFWVPRKTKAFIFRTEKG